MMKKLAHTLVYISLSLSSLLLFDLKPALGPVPATLLRYLRIMAGALSFFTAVLGLLGASLGLFSRAPLALLSGLVAALLSARHILQVTAPHPGFEEAFGPDWSDRPPSKPFPQRRWSWRLPPAPTPRWERNVPFCSLPGSGRQLFCDLWLPPQGRAPSRLAFIYFHGGAWRTLDKDTQTRTFFRHLAAQGHVVMDANYRLYPEVTLLEMLGDTRRAVAWMKANGLSYGVDPERIVVGGGSAGAHLALLNAYTAGHPQLTPEDLRDVDTTVRAAVAYYPPVDLAAYVAYKAYGPFALGPVDIPGRREVLSFLLGGTVEEAPEAYALFSPLSHVRPGCPPTLLLAAECDDIVPVEPVTEMHHRLAAAGVPSILVCFPGSEHGFDLALPRYSPAAQAALYDVQRFLALMA